VFWHAFRFPEKLSTTPVGPAAARSPTIDVTANANRTIQILPAFVAMSEFSECQVGEGTKFLGNADKCTAPP
jgi:hypothetical protein